MVPVRSYQAHQQGKIQAIYNNQTLRYSDYMKVISIIRDRGQLTIPDSIRKTVKWANSMSAVSITVVKPNEIIIKPQQSYVDWQEIWAGIKKARAVTGKSKAISSVDFLQRDRVSH